MFISTGKRVVMNVDFGFVVCGGIELLVFLPWWQQGLLHGMTTSSLHFEGDELEQDLEVFRQSARVTGIVLPSQCHGASVMDLRTREKHQFFLERDGGFFRRERADAVAAPANQVMDSSVLAYGVYTADCVPIIVRGESGYVVIHAGWRGLAAGVIPEALQYVAAPQEAVVFAAASSEKYEVGKEVLDAIGASAVARPCGLSPGKYLLDTAATAACQLRIAESELAVRSAGICTISDSLFHSYRREGDRSGRCLTFVIPSRK